MSLMPLTRDWRRLILLGRTWQKRPRCGLPPDQSVLPRAAPLSYVIAAAAQDIIDLHVQASPAEEVGGLLLGEVYEEQGLYLVNITQALPARYTTAGMAHLTFTGAAWLDLIMRRAELPELKTVGWYHSHPGLGVFLSGSDIFIHRSFFGDEPWYIALVVDPQSGEQGVFGWQGQQLIRCDPTGDNAPQE